MTEQQPQNVLISHWLFNFKGLYLLFLFSNRFQTTEQEGAASLLEQLEKKVQGEEDSDEEEEERGEEGSPCVSASSLTREEEDETEVELGDLEEELRLLHQQDSLLEQVCFSLNDQIRGLHVRIYK